MVCYCRASAIIQACRCILELNLWLSFEEEGPLAFFFLEVDLVELGDLGCAV